MEWRSNTPLLMLFTTHIILKKNSTHMKNVMNHAIATAIGIAIPYMIIGMIWLLSGCSFSYTAVVTNGNFFAVSFVVSIILTILFNFYVDQGDLNFFEW
jgi:hypothetical protein